MKRYLRLILVTLLTIALVSFNINIPLTAKKIKKVEAATTQVASYDIRQASIEYGSLYSGSPEALHDNDGDYYAVSSTTTYPYRVAWYTKVLCHVNKSAISRLTLTFVAKYSAPTNDQWIALWNFNTGNWEAIDQSTTSTSDVTRVWTTTDPAALGRFISNAGEIWVRVYNSKDDGTFIRYSDWLNITIEYNPEAQNAQYTPTAVTAEYGTITSGDYTSLAAQDGIYLEMASTSTSPYKAAWQASASIDVNRNYVSCLTVKYVGHLSTTSTNRLYLSLWNFVTGNWEVVRTFWPSTSDTTQIWSSIDADEIQKYISSTGEIKVRLYNSSSSSSFSRFSDFLNIYIEYGSVGTFCFAHYTDVHQEATTNTSLGYVIDDLNLYVKPAFVVNTGDTANHSYLAEFDSYNNQISSLQIPRKEAAGNHDVRWYCPNGKADWRQKIGQPLYQSFDYAGVHFVVLDTSVFMENDGALDPKVLNWLEQDLASIAGDTPVVLFGHHPNHDVSGLVKLISLLQGKNVKCFLGGHDHVWEIRYENGIPWIGVEDVKYSIKYAVIRVTPTHIKIYKRDPQTHSGTLWLTFPLRKLPRTSPVVEVTGVDANTGKVEVKVTVNTPVYPIIQVEARVDGYGSWVSLTKDATGAWVGSIDVSTYTPPVPRGRHFVEARASDEYSNYWFGYATYLWSDGNIASSWSFTTGGAIQAAPAVYGDKVYVGSADGKLYALNGLDGTLLWSYATGGEICSTPAIYVGTSGTSIIFGSADKYVYSLDAATGGLKWSYLTGGAVLSSPLCYGTYVYVGSGDGKIYCLNAETGGLKWAYQTGGLMRQRPWIENGILYAIVRDNDMWYALDASTGALVWKTSANADTYMPVCDNAPVVAAGKVWVVKPDYTFSALDANSGQIVWTENTPDEFSNRGPATDGQRVFINARSDTVYCFDGQSGNVIWTRALASSTEDVQQKQINSALVYQNGRLYRIAERGRLTVIDSVTGEVKFIYDLADLPERNFWSTPAVDSKGFYVGGLDGKVYGIRWAVAP